MKSILISIVNWNKSECTQKCLESIDKLIHDERFKFQVVVIDNGSLSDDRKKLEEFTRQFVNHKLELVLVDTNLGFTGGHNISIRKACELKYDYIWLLNNDAICSPDCLSELFTTMGFSSDTAAVSPLIVRMNFPSIIDFSVAVYNWNTYRSETPDNKSVEDVERFQHVHKNVWAIGTALLLKVECFEKLIGLDDDFFAYYEDNDLGQRIIDSGWRTRISVNAVIQHEAYDGNMYLRPPYWFYLMTRNHLKFVFKNVVLHRRIYFAIKALDECLFHACVLWGSKKPKETFACLQGYVDGLIGINGGPKLNKRLFLVLLVSILLPINYLWNARKIRLVQKQLVKGT